MTTSSLQRTVSSLLKVALAYAAPFWIIGGMVLKIQRIAKGSPKSQSEYFRVERNLKLLSLIPFLMSRRHISRAFHSLQVPQ